MLRRGRDGDVLDARGLQRVDGHGHAHGRAHCRPQVHYRHVPVRRIRKGRLTLFMERMQMVVRIGDCTWSATGREGSADSKERQGPLWGKVYILVDIQGGPIDEHTHSLG